MLAQMSLHFPEEKKKHVPGKNEDTSLIANGSPKGDYLSQEKNPLSAGSDIRSRLIMQQQQLLSHACLHWNTDGNPPSLPATTNNHPHSKTRVRS